MTEKIPLASEFKSKSMKPSEEEKGKKIEQHIVPEEEKAQKEAFRTEMLSRCCDFVKSYIEDKSKGKMLYRKNRGHKDAYIFKFSPPAARGLKTRFFSQVSYNADAASGVDAFQLTHFRPKNHGDNLWFFPILYVMNGRTKNSKRVFETLQLIPVQESIRQLMETWGYQIRYIVRRLNVSNLNVSNLNVSHQNSQNERPEYVNYVLASWEDPIYQEDSLSTFIRNDVEEVPTISITEATALIEKIRADS